MMCRVQSCVETATLFLILKKVIYGQCYRWDIQRMREQRVFEKLRGQEESAAQNASDDKSNVHTFLPSIDDCEFELLML